MAKKGVYVDLNQLADVLMRKKKKKKRRRRKAVKGVPVTQAQVLQQETTRNAMIRTPYAQQTLYGAGNFNVAGDKFDAGIQAEKRVEGITQQISGIERMGAKEIDQLKEQITGVAGGLAGVESGLQLIMDKSTEPKMKRRVGAPKKNKSVKLRSRRGAMKADAQVQADAQVSSNLNRPLAPAISTVGEGIITMGDGIISAEGKQGGGGVALATVKINKDGTPRKPRTVKPKSDTGKLRPEQLAPFTPNFQNKASAQEQPVLTDVLQQQQDMSGEI
jgi:hypothetical protein